MRRVDWKWWVGTAVGAVGLALGYLALPAQIDPRRVEHVRVASAVAGVVLLLAVAVRCGAWRALKSAVRTVVNGVRLAARYAAGLRPLARALLGVAVAVTGAAAIPDVRSAAVSAARRFVDDRRADPAPIASATPSATPSPSLTPVPTATVPAPTPSATPRPKVTPSPTARPSTRPPVRVSVALRVTHYCICDAVREQIQVKVKVGVTNRGTQSLDVAVRPFSPIRLVVKSNAGRWTPPGSRASVGPMRVRLPNGATGYAYPANDNRAYDYIGDGWGTFATHWAATRVARGREYYDPGNRRGDLVFYAPYESEEVLGLAYVTPQGAVVAFTPLSAWGTETNPNDF